MAGHIISYNCNLAATRREWIDTIPTERLTRLLDSGVKIFLVDLRPTKESQQNRMSGARSIPSTELATRFNEIPKTVRLFFTAPVKKASLLDKTVFLKSQGYRNISVMREEYPEWVKRGYPVETNRQ